MLDLINMVDGDDLHIQHNVAMKAGNIIGTQIGSLNYKLDFGSDLKYFLQEDLKFQTESFKSYLVSRLSEYRVQVNATSSIIEQFSNKFLMSVGESEVKGMMGN